MPNTREDFENAASELVTLERDEQLALEDLDYATRAGATTVELNKAYKAYDEAVKVTDICRNKVISLNKTLNRGGGK